MMKIYLVRYQQTKPQIVPQNIQEGKAFIENF